jgi:hypothetical protein
MYMRSFARGHAVGLHDAARADLLDSSVPDVLAGAGAELARAWWRHDHPEYGWVAVGLLVAAADVTGTKTMSEVFRSASRHPVGRPLMVIGWGVLTAHLFGLIPPDRDPINVMWKRCHHD